MKKIMQTSLRIDEDLHRKLKAGGKITTSIDVLIGWMYTYNDLPIVSSKVIEKSLDNNIQNEKIKSDPREIIFKLEDLGLKEMIGCHNWSKENCQAYLNSLKACSFVRAYDKEVPIDLFFKIK